MARSTPSWAEQGTARARSMVVTTRSLRVSRMRVVMVAMVSQPRPRIMGSTALPFESHEAERAVDHDRHARQVAGVFEQAEEQEEAGDDGQHDGEGVGERHGDGAVGAHQEVVEEAQGLAAPAQTGARRQVVGRAEDRPYGRAQRDLVDRCEREGEGEGDGCAPVRVGERQHRVRARMASGVTRCWKTPVSRRPTRVPAPNSPTNQKTKPRMTSTKAAPLTGCMAQNPRRTPREACRGWVRA